MDYAGNSDKSKLKQEVVPEKKIEKVVTGKVILKKKSFGRKFKDVFFGGDIRTASSYVVADVLLPGLRDMLLNAINKGAEKMVMGDSPFSRRSPTYRPRVEYTNPTYRSASLRDPRQRPAFLPDQPPRYMRPNRREFNDIILEKREDAEAIVERMIDVVDKYRAVSLADLYDMLHERSSPIDNKWGWTFLGGTEVRQVHEGYLVDLPPLEEL